MKVTTEDHNDQPVPPISEAYRAALHRVLDKAIDSLAGRADVEVTYGTTQSPHENGYMQTEHTGSVTIKITPSV